MPFVCVKMLIEKNECYRILAGNLQLDDDSIEIPRLNISYKPQKISPKSQCSVRHLLLEKIPDMVNHAQFKTDVLSPLMIDNLLNLEVWFCCV